MKIMDKRSAIRNHVEGCSFIDIGGLWNTTGEMVTTAAAGGASKLAMADIQPADSIWWEKFDEHCASLGVSDYNRLVADICDPGQRDVIGKYDFVHCSGIMYHVADLFQFVTNLLAITKKYLLISSVVLPDVIDNEKGRLTFPSDAAYLTPNLTQQSLDIVLHYLDENGIGAAGLTDRETPFIDDHGRALTGPWWWLFSGAFMSNFMKVFPVRVVEEGFHVNGRAYHILVEKNTESAA